MRSNKEEVGVLLLVPFVIEIDLLSVFALVLASACSA